MDTGDKSSDAELKAIFRVTGLADFAGKHPSIPILCQAYSDAALVVYESNVEVIDAASGLIACPAKCNSVHSPSK